MKQTYPLEQLATIKKRRLEEAERVLKEKKEQLHGSYVHSKLFWWERNAQESEHDRVTLFIKHDEQSNQVCFVDEELHKKG